jgi:DNA-binding NarL/FixJ family response regulator
MQPLRLAIVDANDLTRNGLQALVSSDKAAVEVIGAFSDLQSLQSLSKDRVPQMLLLNDSLPRSVDIYATVQTLRQKYPGTAILVLSDKLSVRYVQKLLHAGAQGFIYKQDRLRTMLVAGLETVRSGGIYLSPSVSALPFLGDIQHDIAQLKPLDIQVLHLMAEGYTVQEIANYLDIVDRSVYRIRHRLRSALNVRTNEQIVDAARKHGLLNDVME